MLERYKNQLTNLIFQAISCCVDSNVAHKEIALEIPQEKAHGDLSCNVALRLSKRFKMNPMVLAGEIKEKMVDNLAESPLAGKINRIETVRPGFMNFFFDRCAFYEILEDVLRSKDNYGRRKLAKPHQVQIEFVSANPTGPLSVAHARQAAVGDALGNILRYVGHQVTKEYYINDEGNQVSLLGESIRCRASEFLGSFCELPENGYQGDYIRDIAKLFLQKEFIDNLEKLQAIKDSEISEMGVAYLMDVIRKDLGDFGVHFDIWSSQAKIASPDRVAEKITDLQKQGYIYEKEGALWFKSTQFGDDKDRVVKKSNGNFTYLAPDIVYHDNKYQRGFDYLINIWGPDHHGYISRLKAAAQALGHDRDSLVVLIVQLATIYKNGQPLSMSTRKGQYISLREVLDEVGVDAARYFFLMRNIKAHLDFDLELAKKETPENPVYYIQYAHARIHSIIKYSKDSDIEPKSDGFRLLKEDEELDLIREIGQFPDILDLCARKTDPYALTAYLLELATCFHKFYDRNRVVGVEPDLSAERFALIDATRIVISSGLNLLGINAPVKM